MPRININFNNNINFNFFKIFVNLYMIENPVGPLEMFFSVVVSIKPDYNLTLKMKIICLGIWKWHNTTLKMKCHGYFQGNAQIS